MNFELSSRCVQPQPVMMLAIQVNKTQSCVHVGLYQKMAKYEVHEHYNASYIFVLSGYFQWSILKIVMHYVKMSANLFSLLPVRTNK